MTYEQARRVHESFLRQMDAKCKGPGCYSVPKISPDKFWMLAECLEYVRQTGVAWGQEFERGKPEYFVELPVDGCDPFQVGYCPELGELYVS